MAAPTSVSVGVHQNRGDNNQGYYNSIGLSRGRQMARFNRSNQLMRGEPPIRTLYNNPSPFFRVSNFNNTSTLQRPQRAHNRMDCRYTRSALSSRSQHLAARVPHRTTLPRSIHDGGIAGENQSHFWCPSISQQRNAAPASGANPNREVENNQVDVLSPAYLPNHQSQNQGTMTDNQAV